MSGSVNIEADNSPSPEGCETGVTDSSPIGVVGELACPEDLLLCVAITHDHVGLKTVLTHVLLFREN